MASTAMARQQSSGSAASSTGDLGCYLSAWSTLVAKLACYRHHGPLPEGSAQCHGSTFANQYRSSLYESDVCLFFTEVDGGKHCPCALCSVLQQTLFSRSTGP